MSKLRVLELAVLLHQSANELSRTADSILSTANQFAAFVGEEVSATPGKPAATPRKAKPQDVPVVTVDAGETAAEAQQPKTQAADTTATSRKVEQVTAEPPKVTEAEVKELVGKVATNAAAGGAPKAREILGLYGATNISTLKPEKYALVKASLEAALKAAEEAAAIAA